MIIIPPLRTRRVSVRLKELTLSQAEAMCKLPAVRNELSTSSFLKFACEVENPGDGYVLDPRLWTIEERTRVVVQYLIAFTADGPDFSVGSAKLSDYVDFVADPEVREVSGIDVAGRSHTYRPLLGIQSEALEAICETRGDWLIGRIGAQVVPDGEAPDWASMSDVAVLSWHKARMDLLKALPESEFESLMAAFIEASEGTVQFFRTSVSDDGIVCMPIQPGVEVPPGRFPASSCVGEFARRLFAQPAVREGQPGAVRQHGAAARGSSH